MISLFFVWPLIFSDIDCDNRVWQFTTQALVSRKGGGGSLTRAPVIDSAVTSRRLIVTSYNVAIIWLLYQATNNRDSVFTGSRYCDYFMRFYNYFTRSRDYFRSCDYFTHFRKHINLRPLKKENNHKILSLFHEISWLFHGISLLFHEIS